MYAINETVNKTKFWYLFSYMFRPRQVIKADDMLFVKTEIPVDTLVGYY